MPKFPADMLVRPKKLVNGGVIRGSIDWTAIGGPKVTVDPFPMEDWHYEYTPKGGH